MIHKQAPTANHCVGAFAFRGHAGFEAVRRASEDF
jgi:hypothetical protein